MGLFVCLAVLWLVLLVAVWLVLGRSLRRSVYEADLPGERRGARYRSPMHDRT